VPGYVFGQPPSPGAPVGQEKPGTGVAVSQTPCVQIESVSHAMFGSLPYWHDVVPVQGVPPWKGVEGHPGGRAPLDEPDPAPLPLPELLPLPPLLLAPPPSAFFAAPSGYWDVPPPQARALPANHPPAQTTKRSTFER
jgi:hypothetical protein